MTNEDDAFDKLRASVDKALYCDDYADAFEAYCEAKKLQIEYLQRLRYKEESIVDQSLYDILELIMLFDFGEEDETYIKSDEVHLLTRIFKFDPDMRKYCENHVDHDGIVATMKYGFSIQSNMKKQMIMEALALKLP